MPKGSRLLALVVGLALVAVACGGDGGEGASDEALPSTEAADAAADAGEAAEESSPPAGPWERVKPGGDCQCADGSEFSFWVREADPSKVVFFFQGGGACFNADTCSAGDSATSKLTTGPEDDPTGKDGIWDFDNPQNPLADYSFVFVPYCTGDVHLGDRAQEYSPEVTVQHRGFVNGTAALDHLVETFPEAEEVVVAGESAGSIPSPLYAGLVADRLPGAEITVLADGSGAYADDPGINAAIGSLWADRSIPDWPETEGITAEEWSIPGLFTFSGDHAPDISFARHDYAFDEVQKTFIELTGLPGGDNIVGVIDDNERQIEGSGVDLRSYTAPGADHTVLSQDAFYTEEVAGVALVDWVSDLVEDSPVDDVHCERCRQP